jgi:hypothetical protein
MGLKTLHTIKFAVNVSNKSNKWVDVAALQMAEDGNETNQRFDRLVYQRPYETLAFLFNFSGAVALLTPVLKRLRNLVAHVAQSAESNNAHLSGVTLKLFFPIVDSRTAMQRIGAATSGQGCWESLQYKSLLHNQHIEYPLKVLLRP